MPFKIQPIKELRDQQVRYAPREKKIEQLDRAEKFYREIDTEKHYSYKSICYLITEYRPEMYADLLFPGQEVKSDLLQFIDDLADSIVLPVEQAKEPTWTIEQLCERFNVTSKTILRWRKIGLISRRFLIDEKKRVGFLNGSVEYFIESHPKCIRRGKRFSQLTAEERETIIRQAKHLSKKGKTPTEVARQLSQKTGRSIETIRSTLKAFDEANFENAIFPNRNSPLSEATKQKIYLDFCSGETIEGLAKRYKRTLARIYSIIGAYRVNRIMGLPLSYIDNPEFHIAETQRKDAAKENSQEDIVSSEVFVEAENPHEISLLSAEQETLLFRKMNYLKYQANTLRATLNLEKPKNRVMTQIEELYNQAIQIKNEIIAANLHQVVDVAKKHVSPTVNFFELVNEGNLVLMKAVEEFDYSRGSKFNTYATWAMMKHFARTVSGGTRDEG